MRAHASPLVGTSPGLVAGEHTLLNGARFLAGGTDLLTLMKADVVRPSTLVDIKRADGLPHGIEVRDGKGVAVTAGTATLVPGNTAQLRVPLKDLAPGTYKVIWRVLSVDTHRSQGEFSFRVGP